jgi:nucleoside-diphosphate-sugar epimerase
MSDLVLVTGISGFIAKHVALECLKAGFSVRGTLRSLKRADEVRETLKKHGADISRLSFVETDLEADNGWEVAVQGCRFIQHLASPFPLAQPKTRHGLVPAARDGTLRVLRSAFAAGVDRVILTSSVAAMMYKAGRPKEYHFSAKDWSDPNWEDATPYVISKTLAEMAAWDYVKSIGASKRLITVNPGLVLGPALDTATGSSLEVIIMLLKGTYPASPPVYFPTVDVRDVSALHMAGLKDNLKDNLGGQRLLATAGSLSMAQMGRELKAGLGAAGSKVPTGELPLGLVKFLALFDKNLQVLKGDLGVNTLGDAGETERLTGIKFRTPKEAILAAGQSVIDLKLI